VLTATDHAEYMAGGPLSDPVIVEHAADVRWAEALVFVFPTGSMGLPVALKGWLDRVLSPTVAFSLEPVAGGQRVRPGMPQLRAIVGVTTYRGPRWLVRLHTDGGRRTLLRAIWLSAASRPKRVWLALPRVASASAVHRDRFRADVERRMAAL